MTKREVFDRCAGMRFDDIVDPIAVQRIERDHDACVSDDAYEIHVADQASTSLVQAIAAHARGSAVVVHLAHAETVRGTLQDVLVGWLALDVSGRRTFIAHRAIARTHVMGARLGESWPAPSSTFGSVLREHHREGGSLRLRLIDGSAAYAHLVAVGADFVALGDGFLVPFASIDVCELI